MPFRSKSQQKWMFANKPKMAKQWAKETPNINALPDKSKFSGKGTRARLNTAASKMFGWKGK
jgi:hypothetical protein